MHQHIADAAGASSFPKLHRRDSAQNGVISDDTQHGFLLFAVLRIGQAASAERIASIRKLHGAEPFQPIRRGMDDRSRAPAHIPLFILQRDPCAALGFLPGQRSCVNRLSARDSFRKNFRFSRRAAAVNLHAEPLSVAPLKQQRHAALICPCVQQRTILLNEQRVFIFALFIEVFTGNHADTALLRVAFFRFKERRNAVSERGNAQREADVPFIRRVFRFLRSEQPAVFIEIRDALPIIPRKAAGCDRQFGHDIIHRVRKHGFAERIDAHQHAANLFLLPAEDDRTILQHRAVQQHAVAEPFAQIRLRNGRRLIRSGLNEAHAECAARFIGVWHGNAPASVSACREQIRFRFDKAHSRRQSAILCQLRDAARSVAVIDHEREERLSLPVVRHSIDGRVFSLPLMAAKLGHIRHGNALFCPPALIQLDPLLPPLSGQHAAHAPVIMHEGAANLRFTIPR